MSDMTLKETTERLMEGLKMAASRAKELGRAQNSPAWTKISNSLELMRTNCEMMIKSKGLTRAEVLRMVDQRQKTFKIDRS